MSNEAINPADRIAGIDMNYNARVEINTTPTASSGTYVSLCNAFKNINMALNEVIFSTSYLADGGYSSSAVTGLQPKVTLNGEFNANDAACVYFNNMQWQTGKSRVTDIKMRRAGQQITVPVTMENITISGGDATAPNAISVTIAFNGAPTVQQYDTLALDITGSIPASTVGTAITDIDISTSVSGGKSPYTYAILGFPNGISISSAGVIGGTPTAKTFAGTGTVTVTDADNIKVSAPMSYGAVSPSA